VRQGTGAAQSDGDRIETPYLQLVMTRLWTEEQRQGSQVLRVETLAALGDTTAIVATYLDDIMKALSEEEQALAARGFDRLVTRSGSKVALTQADIVGYAGGSQQVVEQLLRTLVGQRVLHVVPYTLGESRYEITHDVLGQAILQWQERFQLKEDQRAEAQRLREEAQSLLAETQRQAAEKLAEEQQQAAKRLRKRNQALVFALAVAVVAILAAAVLLFIALIQYQAARNPASVAENQPGPTIEAKATADVNAAEVVNAKATARANLSLAQQKLDELKVEELLAGGRDQKARLDVNGAIADFNAAAVAATGMGKVLDVSGEISDTVRYVATTYVQEGEKILCEAFFDQPEKCRVPITDASAAPITTSVLISQTYLAWAHDAAPQIVGWSSYTSTVQQHAVISATALFSQALTLNPPSDTPVYIWIAPGAFAIGSTAEQCEKAGVGECPSDEQPSHTVELDGYWIQRTEVTNEQYTRCVEAGVCEPPANAYWDKPSSARLPVTDLDWNEASAFAAWVGGRLPTEAEWEKGCRGANERVYPWDNALPSSERLNYNYEFGSATEVGGFPAGANGLYDMAGNVWEWTADWYNEEYYSSSAARNPVGPEEGEYRTLRGGTWTSNGNEVRCAHRIPGDSNLRLYDGGFRVVTP
jgi:formylglycine-generating enzyme required for sulfatase activity